MDDNEDDVVLIDDSEEDDGDGGGGGSSTGTHVSKSLPCAILDAMARKFVSEPCCSRCCCWHDSIYNISTIRRSMPEHEADRLARITCIMRPMLAHDDGCYAFTHPSDNTKHICQVWFCFLFDVCPKKVHHAKNILAADPRYNAEFDRDDRYVRHASPRIDHRVLARLLLLPELAMLLINVRMRDAVCVCIAYRAYLPITQAQQDQNDARVSRGTANFVHVRHDIGMAAVQEARSWLAALADNDTYSHTYRTFVRGSISVRARVYAACNSPDIDDAAPSLTRVIVYHYYSGIQSSQVRS